MQGRLWAFATLLLFFVAIAVAQTIPRGVAVPLTTLFPQPGLYSYPYWYLAIAALASPVQITGGTLASGIYKGVEYQFDYLGRSGRWRRTEDCAGREQRQASRGASGGRSRADPDSGNKAVAHSKEISP